MTTTLPWTGCDQVNVDADLRKSLPSPLPSRVVTHPRRFETRRLRPRTHEPFFLTWMVHR
jgi:hypothetical protein